jgi:hypothetical protein
VPGQAIISQKDGANWLVTDTQGCLMTASKEMSREDLAKMMVELIRSDGRLRSAIVDIVFSCPNIVTQI